MGMKDLNQYATYYKRRPTDELREIAFQKELYHDDARMAALLELQTRGEDISEEGNKELEVLTANAKEVAREKQKVKSKTSAQSEALPEWYSPAAILGFSIFFSVIFGGVLMYANLRKAGKKTEATTAILISLGIMLVSAYLVHVYKVSQWVALLSNVSGALILIEYFWKKHLGYQTKFKRKPLTKAILISVSIALIAILIVVGAAYYFPEHFPQINKDM